MARLSLDPQKWQREPTRRNPFYLLRPMCQLPAARISPSGARPLAQEPTLRSLPEMPSGCRFPCSLAQARVGRLGHCPVQDFDRMPCFTTGAIQDLMPTTGSRRGDQMVFRFPSNGWEQNQLTDLHREFILVQLVTKSPGHPTTSRSNQPDMVIQGETAVP